MMDQNKKEEVPIIDKNKKIRYFKILIFFVYLMIKLFKIAFVNA
jgi:hypothetical protein